MAASRHSGPLGTFILDHCPRDLGIPVLFPGNTDFLWKAKYWTRFWVSTEVVFSLGGMSMTLYSGMALQKSVLLGKSMVVGRNWGSDDIFLSDEILIQSGKIR